MRIIFMLNILLKKNIRLALFFVFVIMLSVLFYSKSNANQYYNPQKIHHTPSGFVNKYTSESTGFASFLKWRWQRFNSEISQPKFDLSPVQADLSLINSKSNEGDIKVTWIGHATNLIQTNNINILTDPIFSNRASPVQFGGPIRYQSPGLSINQLPHIDIVVISHNHYDHLDFHSINTLANLDNPPIFYVPLGIDIWFENNIVNPRNKAKLKNNIIAMDWSDKQTFKDIDLTLEPVQHWSARGVFDRKNTLWGSWVFQTKQKSIWFSGDLGYSKDIDDLAIKYPNGFDLALIAIGAYKPEWFMGKNHINPEQAVQIHSKIKSKLSIGIHWGTFTLADEALDEPLIDLDKAKKKHNINANEFITLHHGQTVRL
jgi:N-acyl-phosphatidylethanolamine-hydrolysing phospholipase D